MDRKPKDGKEIYAKILDTYPDISELNIGVNIHYDSDYDVWIVRFEQKGQRVYTHLEPEEVQSILEGEKCVGLDTQIKQITAEAKYRQ